MKRAIILEVIWLAAILVVSFLLVEFVSTGKAADINMHDTYIVGGAFGSNLTLTYFIFAYFTTIGFFVYLIRVVYFECKVILTDIVLLILTCLALYFLSDILFIVHPPVIDQTSAAPIKGLFYGGSYSSSYTWGIRIVKIFLMLVLAFTGFMIGRNRGLSPKK